MTQSKIRYIAIILALMIASLACSFSFSTASMEDAWTSRDEAGLERTTTFDPTDVFYAKIQIENAPDDTIYKAVWIAVDTPVSEPNFVIDEVELEGGSGTHTFSLSGDQPWPPGVYKVDLYMDDELTRSLSFEVIDNTPPPTEAPLPTGAAINMAYMARDEEGYEETTSFSPYETFFAIVELVDAPADTRVEAVWVAVEVPDTEPNYVIDQTELTSGSDILTFSLTNDQPWPNGKYKVDLYLNGMPDRTIGFLVEGEAPVADGPYIADAYMALDAEGEQQTNVFSSSDIFYAHIQLENAPDDTQIKAVWTDSVNSFTYETDFVSGSDWIYFELSNSEPWPAGGYQVEFYINGNFDTLIEFSVQ